MFFRFFIFLFINMSLFFSTNAFSLCEDPFFNPQNIKNSNFKVILSDKENMWFDKSHIEPFVTISSRTVWDPSQVVKNYYPEQSNFCLQNSDLVILTQKFELQNLGQIDFKNRNIWVIAKNIAIEDQAKIKDAKGLHLVGKNVKVGEEFIKKIKKEKVDFSLVTAGNWQEILSQDTSGSDRIYPSYLVLKSAFSLANYFFKNQNLNIEKDKFLNLEESHELLHAILALAPKKLVQQIKKHLNIPKNLVPGTSELDLILLLNPNFGPIIYESLWLVHQLELGLDPYGYKSFYVSKRQLATIDTQLCTADSAKKKLALLMQSQNTNYFSKKEILMFLDQCELLSAEQGVDLSIFSNSVPRISLGTLRQQLEILSNQIKNTVTQLNVAETEMTEKEQKSKKLKILLDQSVSTDRVTTLQMESKVVNLKKLSLKIINIGKNIKHIEALIEKSKEYYEALKQMPAPVNNNGSDFDRAFDIFATALTGTDYGNGLFTDDWDSPKFDFSEDSEGSGAINLGSTLIKLWGAIENQNYTDKVHTLREKKKEISDKINALNSSKQDMVYAAMINQQLDSLAEIYSQISLIGLDLQKLSKKLADQERYREKAADLLAVKSSEVRNREFLEKVLIDKVTNFKMFYTQVLYHFDYITGENFFGNEAKLEDNFRHTKESTDLYNLTQCYNILNIVQSKSSFRFLQDSQFVNSEADPSNKYHLMQACIGVIDDVLSDFYKLNVNSGNEIYINKNKSTNYKVIHLPISETSFFVQKTDAGIAKYFFDFKYEGETFPGRHFILKSTRNTKIIDATIWYDVKIDSQNIICKNSQQFLDKDDLFTLDSGATEFVINSKGLRVFTDVSGTPAFKTPGIDTAIIESISPGDNEHFSEVSHQKLDRYLSLLPKRPLGNVVNRSLMNNWELQINEFEKVKTCVENIYIVYKYSFRQVDNND